MSAGPAGHYILDREVLPVMFLLALPPIKLSRPRRRSAGPVLGHRYFSGEVTAIAGPASPPLGNLFGLISGAPLSSQLRAHRPDNHRTPLVPSVLLRRRVLGRGRKEEF
ncbi:hypothetical protein NDU88_003805 [Pleurodeles waltl]|uniref:Uncharacterized protein n=1 Tax=Pleurodeles waltl TaxID=8319 RepID=A0AAV7QAR5_PLEWA|nr:hypothetical protein NDU88_003805 [Pleurodeles waltl]